MSEPVAVAVKRADSLVLLDGAVRLLSPLWIIFIRSARVYLSSLTGLLAAHVTGAAGDALPAGDFFHLLWICSGLAIAPAVISALLNALELFNRLDQSHPQLRG